MKSTKRLLVGAIAILSAMALYPMPADAKTFDRYTEIAQLADTINEDAGETQSRNTALDEFLRKNGSDVTSNTIENYNKGQTVTPIAPVNNNNNAINQVVSIKEGWNTPNNNLAEVFYAKGGVKQLGWQKISVYWYYFDTTTGNLKTNSWIESSGNWYFVDSLGHMLRDTFVDSQYVDIDGTYIASKNDSSKGKGLVSSHSDKQLEYFDIWTDSTCTSKLGTQSHDALVALQAQGKLGVNLHYEYNQAGAKLEGLNYYIK